MNMYWFPLCDCNGTESKCPYLMASFNDLKVSMGMFDKVLYNRLSKRLPGQFPIISGNHGV